MTISQLTAEQLYLACDTSQWDFTTTTELEPISEPLGQQRALEAIEFAVDMQRDGYNLFVVGQPGLGKHQLIRQVLGREGVRQKPLYDWCYINNFANPQKPKVMQLPSGMAQKLRRDMETLVEDLLTSLPSSFQSEEYRNRRQAIEDEFQQRQEQAFKKLSKEAKEKGVAVMRTPNGYTLGPVKDGELIDTEVFKKLPQEEQNRIEKIIDEMQLELQEIIRQMPLMLREHHQRIKALNHEITRHTVELLIAWIENNYHDQPAVLEYLAEVKQSAIENVDAFLPKSSKTQAENISTLVAQFHEYQINIIVDNTDTASAPIIVEDNPTYQNLIGRVEYISQMGTLLTDFTLIKPGALQRANGGFLVLEARKVLSNAFAWEGLKRAVKANEVVIESLEAMLSLARTLSLEPQSIPLDVKVILTGEPLLFYLLKQYDPEFSQLFKVMADFSETTPRSGESTQLYARLISAMQQQHNIRPLNRQAVARIIEHAARAAADSEKLSLQMDSMADLLHESDYWAGKAGADEISETDVARAIDKQRTRQNKYQQLLQEQISRGIRVIATEGEQVAQVNGLSVLQTGDYAFGLPSRITATARLGQGGVTDIEREAKLGGHIHAKGVMILSAYLASHYAQKQPLPLSATLTFEQSYGMVDGDSASAAELCALLSALGNLPLKQSLAVTGSINQFGELQAIGGVNEKIEGFFELCQTRGLSGEQGVIIPHSNQVHLMLREEVREAVVQQRFHIYTADHVQEVMQLLCGLPAGSTDAEGNYPEGSFNRQIQAAITRLQQLRKQFSDQSHSKSGSNGEGSE